MDYSKIRARGLDYMLEAGLNWDSRKRKLIQVWYERDRPKRIFDITCELDDRVTMMGSLYRADIKKAKQREEEYNNRHIRLECPSFECRYAPEGVIILTRASNYTPGEIKCDKCGAALEPINDDTQCLS